MEAWTLLAGLAAVTSRIRLGTLVTGITYRHPSVLAAEAVTVDHISGGRVEIAIGAAWFEQEHIELGIEFPPRGERVERLEEAVDVIRLLLTKDRATYGGKHYRLEEATYNPKPVQKPMPPLWIGASGEQKMLPLVARKADAWHGFGDVATIGQKMAIIDRHAADAGRDPKEILRATSLSISEPIDEIRRRAEMLRDTGIDYLQVSWPGEGYAQVQSFVDQVMPEFSG
jgi:alkanesulfonate monooxygenase SsuD/methylene tetrahydromethanopterin reductase-like flavin-dependent oxidoreductase (luciferase family)